MEYSGGMGSAILEFAARNRPKKIINLKFQINLYNIDVINKKECGIDSKI